TRRASDLVVDNRLTWVSLWRSPPRRPTTQPLSAARGSSRKNQNHSLTNAMVQTPVSWAARGACRSADCPFPSLRRNGSTTPIASTSPPHSAPSSNAASSSTPRPPWTAATPRSRTTGCRLSAPTAAPSATDSTATRIRSSRMRGACGLVLRGQRDHVGDPLAQVLARLEMGDVLARQRHRVAGLGVAARARGPEVQRKTAETAGLDAVAAGERGRHHLQQRFDREVDVVGLQVRLALGEDLDQFRFGHLRHARGSWGRPATRAAPRSRRPAARGRTQAAEAAVALTRTCSPAARAAARPAWWCRWRLPPPPCCTRRGSRPPRPRPWRGSTAAGCGSCGPGRCTWP